MQGGTISVVTPLFAGSWSSFCGVELELEAPLFEPPPGVTKIVLAGGGSAELLLLLLLELDELLELVLVGGWQGWIATDSCSEPFGITS